MEKKMQPGKPMEIPVPQKREEIVPPFDPEEPFVIVPEEIPDIIPDEELNEPPPYEIEIPGEGP